MSTGITEAARDRVLRAAIVAELAAAIGRVREDYPTDDRPGRVIEVTVAVAVRETNDWLLIEGPVGTLERLCALLGGGGE